MEKYSKIRLLTDFSEISENATDYAFLIAEKTKLEVEVMHIVNTPLDWVKLNLEQEKLYPETQSEINIAKNNLHSLIQKFEKKGLAAHQNLIYNVGVENIPKYIAGHQDSLLIMGTHGASGLKEYALGSNAQKVIRKADSPVLVVKRKPEKKDISKIILASTFDENQYQAFQKFHLFSNVLKLKCALLYINTPYNFKETPDIDKLLSNFCELEYVKDCQSFIYNALNEERGLKGFMENSEFDILAMATEGRSSFAQFFSPSVTESIINHLDIPVLSFRSPS